MTRARALAWAAAGFVLAGFCIARLDVGTDITRFMPDDAPTELADVSMRLADSPLSRTMVLSVGAEEPAAARAVARELADFLDGHEEIAWVRTAFGEAQLRTLFEVYFPRRHALLSDAPEREIPELLADEALRARAREVVQRLTSPAASLLEELVARDPIGAFERVAERFRSAEPALRTEGGQLVTADGRHAIVLAATRASAFASGPQGRLLADVDAAFAEIAARTGGAPRLEMAGANRFAVAAEAGIRRDVWLIGALSFVGVGALFFAFVGSLRGFLVVSVPPLAGILVATSVGLAALGRLDGLTMVFGASLMGIAVDYSNHLLIHQGLRGRGASPSAMARRLAPTLALGAVTTVASLAGWALTAFPAFREMSFFAAVGVVAALGVSLTLLPDLLGGVPPLPGRTARTAAALGRLHRRLEAAPRALPVALLAVGAAGVLTLPSLRWTDDVSRLTRFEPELVDEDRRVRERVGRPGGGFFAIGLAADEPAAVALSDAVHQRLGAARAAGAFLHARSLHDLLWSAELQRRNLAQVHGDPWLADRVERAFAQEGFRPEALAGFRQTLADGPPQPLRLEELRAGPLGDLLAPYLFRLGDRVAVVSYLEGLTDAAAVRAALADLDHVHLLDQRSFVTDVYRDFRRTTLRQVLVGSALVLLLLALRYRAWRPTLAAVLPSLVVAALLLAGFALSGVHANLLHVMSLVMVMGMGVDYGVFLVDSAGDAEAVGATLLSLLLSCLTTACVFGVLAFSSQPSLQAIGVTTGGGILLSWLLAPVALVAVRPRHGGAT